jgi:hypothetical protein
MGIVMQNGVHRFNASLYRLWPVVSGRATNFCPSYYATRPVSMGRYELANWLLPPVKTPSAMSDVATALEHMLMRNIKTSGLISADCPQSPTAIKMTCDIVRSLLASKVVSSRFRGYGRPAFAAVQSSQVGQ